MAKQRCKDTTLDSFFGHFLYQHKVPEGHFLRKLDEVIEWSGFTRRLLGYYRGRGEIGQAPYSPVLILKMLLLSYLYDISERQVEMQANDSLAVACFLGASLSTPRSLSVLSIRPTMEADTSHPCCLSSTTSLSFPHRRDSSGTPGQAPRPPKPSTDDAHDTSIVSLMCLSELRRGNENAG